MNELNPEAEAFIQLHDNLIAQGKLLAAALPPNTVQVWPGGNSFTSIQAAVDSITQASFKDRYQVAVGPGTYQERVTLKPFIALVGAGADQTTIVSQGFTGYAGTVMAVGDSSVGEITLQSTGGGWGTYPCALYLVEPGKFRASGVTLMATDSGQDGNNVRTVSNNAGAETGLMLLGSCTISAIAQSGQSTAMCLESINSGFSYVASFCTIHAQGSSYGVVTAAGGGATLNDSTIHGDIYALYKSDSISPITANRCNIQGEVSPGVVINS